MNLPQRKSQRLKNYDYSQNAAYFVTICTQNHLCLFGKISNETLILNDAGKMVSDKFAEIPKHYPHIEIIKYVVMPNHLHAILLIQNDESTKGHSATMTLSEYIRRFKTLTTKLYIEGVKANRYPAFNKRVWQRSYHDHVIRNEADFLRIYEYIETNPLKWHLDKYYKE